MKKLLIILPILILLTGCSLLPGGGGSTSSSKGVFKSFDKGDSWQEKNNIKDSESRINRLNVHKLAQGIFDKNILYLGTNKGFYISETGAENWQALIANSNINDFILNPKTHGIIYIATGNQLYKTTNNAESWELIYTEARPNVTLQSLAISYFDTSQIYILTNDGVLMKSNDWGGSWQAFYNFESQTKKLLIDPHNSQNMYVVADNKLFRSQDQGQTWLEILQDKNKDLPGITEFKQLLFTKQPNHLKYLSKYGILSSADNGNTWTAYTLISPPGSVDIKAVAFNLENENEIYYAVDNILYHTLDNGSNWKTKIIPASGNIRVKELLIDSNDTNILYLGLTQ